MGWCTVTLIFQSDQESKKHSHLLYCWDDKTSLVLIFYWLTPAPHIKHSLTFYLAWILWYVDLKLYTENQSLQTPLFCKRYFQRGSINTLNQLVCFLLQGARGEILLISCFSGTFDACCILNKSQEKIDKEWNLAVELLLLYLWQKKGNLGRMSRLQEERIKKLWPLGLS